MSSYNWNDAPEWANYAATDKDGRAHWFEDRPSYYGEEWLNSTGNTGRMEFYKAFPVVPTLSCDSLERRPNRKGDDKLSLKEQVLSLFTTGALIVGECNGCEGAGRYEDGEDGMSICPICLGTGFSVMEGYE